jgi:hypothetical protein
MRFNMLGRTGFRVPEVSLGLGTLVGTEQLDEKVGMCMEAGVCLFDTADAYSEGKSGGLDYSGKSGANRVSELCCEWRPADGQSKRAGNKVCGRTSAEIESYKKGDASFNV